MALADKLRELRTQRSWTQLEVAKRSGLDRRYISYLEQPKNTGRPSADAFLKLARTFNIKPEELYEAAGYIKSMKQPTIRPDAPDELINRLKVALPIKIPIYEEFAIHAGDSAAPIDYIYRNPRKAIGKNLEGYRVNGDCLEPQITDGDIIIIDRIGEINNGDIVAYLADGQLSLGRLKKIADELWLENNLGEIKFEDCQITAKVVEIRRAL